jgi:hypothetical protein
MLRSICSSWYSPRSGALDERDAFAHFTRRLLCTAKLANRPQEACGAFSAARTRPGIVACLTAISREEAQDDATLLAIRDQERAGLDIITDGEQRRESYSNRFATALEGVDIDNPGTALDRSGHPNPVPRVTGRIRRKFPIEVRSNSCALIQIAGSRSPCLARSRWRSRHRTTITRTSRRWCSTMRRP